MKSENRSPERGLNYDQDKVQEKATEEEFMPEVPDEFIELADKKIKGIISEVDRMEFNSSKIEELNSTVGLSSEQFEKAKEGFGIKDKLSEIAKNARQLGENAKSKLKTLAVVGAITLAVSAESDFSKAAETASVPETANASKEVFVTKSRWWENAGNVYEKKMEEWEKGMLTNPNECVAVSIVNKDGRLIFLEREEGELLGSFENIISGEYKEIFIEDISKKNYKLERIHSHPLESAVISNIISKETAEKIRSGQLKSFPMPPSIVDVNSAINLIDQVKVGMKDKFGDFLKSFKEKVMDPTGIWEYSVDESHPYIVKFKEDREQYIKYLNNEEFDQKKADEFSKEYSSGFSFEREIIKKNMELLEKEEVNNEEIVKYFIDAYKERGINLIYKPHKK